MQRVHMDDGGDIRVLPRALNVDGVLPMFAGVADNPLPWKSNSIQLLGPISSKLKISSYTICTGLRLTR
jgi:hypothetical protein